MEESMKTAPATGLLPGHSLMKTLLSRFSYYLKLQPIKLFDLNIKQTTLDLNQTGEQQEYQTNYTSP